MNPKDGEVEVKTCWRPSTGDPSAAWRRLVSKLFKKRGEPAGTRQDASDERMSNENDATLSHE